MKNTLIIMMLVLIIVSGCTVESPKKQIQNVQNSASGMSCAGDACGFSAAQTTKAEIQKIEVIHFHGTNQCASCIAVGKLAEETVNTYFTDEVKSGKVTFAHINAELAENQELAHKYGVTGSSLWIGAYDNKGFHAEQNTNVWYKINNKEEYMTYLKGIIDKRLAGDFS